MDFQYVIPSCGDSFKWIWSFQIGLDPAFPLYMFIDPSSRLSIDAADFVDIIHTDGGVLGYPWPLGHADFYPNQGILQPGCASIIGKSKLTAKK